MHIVFITHEYPKKGINGGGIGSVVQFLGREFVKKNISISVVGINNSYKNEEENDNGISVYRVSKSKWKFGKFYQNTQNILNKIEEINKIEKVNIVEGSELSFAFFPNNTSYKKVIRLHGGHHFFALELRKKTALWRSFQERRSFKNADSFIAVSNYVGIKTQKYLKNNFSFKTIYNSVDTDKFKPANKLLIKKNTLLFVGTVCEKKGVRQLVQSIKFIKERIPDIQLNIVGRDWFFPNGNSYVDYLKTFITKDIEDNINIIGAVQHIEIPKYIEKAEICVYPSHMEAMPIAWLEGLSMGKAVVASNIGPGREAIVNNITGVLIDPHSPKDIANKIVNLLLDKEKLNYISLNAREDIVHRFNVEHIVNENIKFYKSVI